MWRMGCAGEAGRVCAPRAGPRQAPAGRRQDRADATDRRKGLNLVEMNDRLVWIDCEMTGLDVERDALIEIACLVTDAELNLLDGGIDLIIKPPAEALDQMSDVVRDMHTASGLLADL